MKKSLILIILFFLACEAIFVEDISNNEVELISPGDSVVIEGGNVNFYWDFVKDAESYKIQIVQPSFENAVDLILDSITSDTSLSKELNVGDYQWRVKAINSEYETSYSIRSLIVN